MRSLIVVILLAVIIFFLVGCIGTCNDKNCFVSNLKSCNSGTTFSNADGNFYITGNTSVKMLLYEDDKWCGFVFSRWVGVTEGKPIYTCKNPVVEGGISKCSDEELNQKELLSYDCKYRFIDCERETSESMKKVGAYFGVTVPSNFSSSYCSNLKSMGLKESYLTCYINGKSVGIPKQLEFIAN
jgi:hypothetical protein